MLYVDLLVILSSFNGVKLCKREKIVFLTKSARVRTFLKLHLQLQILHRYLQEKLTYFQERFVSFVIFKGLKIIHNKILLFLDCCKPLVRQPEIPVFPKFEKSRSFNINYYRDALSGEV